MPTFLHTQFKKTFKENIPKSTKILLALSCGQDSLCLLQLLLDSLKIQNHQIHAIYIDHQWKNDSLNHIHHIINLLKTRKVPLTIYQTKTLCISENTARELRYKILIKFARSQTFETIITGHNKDDQAETFLQNLIRGTSLNGINNLKIYKKIHQNIAIFRPLVTFSRTEIEWFCRLFYLPIWSDLTNYNFNLQRNRIRHELIPYIYNYFNPKIYNSLSKFIAICQNDNEYIKEVTLKLYISIMHKRLISINIKKLKKQHISLQEKVIKLFFYYHFQKQVNKKFLDRLLDLNHGKDKDKFFFNRISIYINLGNIYVSNIKRPV